MPIKGLSDKRRFTRGGHLRLGIKKKSAKGGEYPEKSDHFIADFENDSVAKLFYATYGSEPKRVTIAFASEHVDDIFSQYYKAYGSSSGLKCKGNGVTAGRITEKGELAEVDCPGPEHCDFAKRAGCKQMAALQFFIKGLPGIQIFQVNTTSFNSIINLNSGIELLQTVRGTKPIRGVWVDLILFPQDAQANGRKVNIFVMKIDIPVSLDNLQSLECAFEPAKVLPAPDMPPDDARDEYLTPTQPDAKAKDEAIPVTATTAATPAPATIAVSAARQALYDRLGAYCARKKAEKGILLKDLLNRHGVTDINKISDTQLEAEINRLEASEAPPEPKAAPDRTPEPEEEIDF